MTDPLANDTQALAARYAALWNEPDAQARRDGIARLWAPDGAHFVKTLEARGQDALHRRITDSHDKNVRERGNVFRARQDARRLRDVVTFTWEMVSAAGGPVLAVGVEFLQLDAQGRIVADYQFVLA